MKRDKAVGTRYTFRFENENTINDILVTIEKKLRRHCTRDKDNGFLMIRMTDTKVIYISYKRGYKTVIWNDFRLLDVHYPGYSKLSLPWIFKMEVMESKG